VAKRISSMISRKESYGKSSRTSASTLHWYARPEAAHRCNPKPSRRPDWTAGSTPRQRRLSRTHRVRNDPSRNRFAVANHTVALSSIFKWYRSDFGGETGVLRLIAKYTPANVGKMLQSPGVKVTYLKYDWALNKQ